MKFASVVLAAGLVSVSSLLVSAEVYLQEKFPEITLDKRWISSKHNSDLGEFKVSPGKFFADEKESLGLQTSQDARFYAISAKFDKKIDNADKNLVVQFSVKNEQNIDCGGGYAKLLPPEFNQEDFRGESLYNIMFGPDICGVKRKVHVIFHHAGENKEIKKEISAPIDQLTHLYTLIVRPDQTYSVLIDNKEEESGKLEDDFDFLPPAEIKDPDAKKPEDWVDEAKIPDPTDVKPDDWVDGPELIPDPDAEKPEDWDDEMDGDWEAPQVPNPEYKGEWKQRQIDNPAYKGVWKTPMIPNPDYKEDPLLHAYNSSYIGFDLWQVKSGTIFDNILITDDIEYAEKFANETFEAWREAEREAKRALDKSEEEITDPEYDEEEMDEVQNQEEPEKPKEEHKVVDLPIVDEGKVNIEEGESNVEEKPSDTPVVDESGANVEEIPSDTSTILSSSSTPESLAKKEEEPTTAKAPVSATQEYEDEFDQMFADFEEEFGPDHKREEL